VAIVAAAGCYHMGPPEDDYDWDDDADGDGGGDLDTDADSDGDSDSDSDSGSEVDTGPPTCPVNSGWPCVCDFMSQNCDDGGMCGMIAGLEDSMLGICSVPCDTPEGPCPDTFWDAEALCLLTYPPDETLWCGLICDSDDECPPQQTCQYVSPDFYFCHP
jgi:hypothetical protein